MRGALRAHTASLSAGLFFAHREMPIRKRTPIRNGPDGRRDLVEKLHASGVLSLEHVAAARRFERDFQAALAPHPTSRWDGVPATPHRYPAAVTDRSVDALATVRRAIAQLGGSGSLRASVLWAVVGEGRSLSSWTAARGVPDRKTARGLLIGALDDLACDSAWRHGTRDRGRRP